LIFGLSALQTAAAILKAFDRAFLPTKHGLFRNTRRSGIVIFGSRQEPAARRSEAVEALL
jgi:hypothetical protein